MVACRHGLSRMSRHFSALLQVLEYLTVSLDFEILLQLPALLHGSISNYWVLKEKQRSAYAVKLGERKFFPVSGSNTASCSKSTWRRSRSPGLGRTVGATWRLTTGAAPRFSTARSDRIKISRPNGSTRLTSVTRCGEFPSGARRIASGRMPRFSRCPRFACSSACHPSGQGMRWPST